ncbi:MAG TPA: hypothetical protein VFR70_02195 [Flavobacterium sp.]|nr:hypothetical protein [Flavobacterium sp.]
MKKILLVAAISLSFGINASTSAERIFSAEISLNQEKEYTLIEPSAIPGDVLKNISSKYGGFTIKEAYMAKNGDYKLVLSKDDKTATAYFTLKGEFIKEA